MKRILLTASVLALVLTITEVSAQTTSDFAVKINTVTELTATNTGLATPFTFSTMTDLEDGITRSNAVTLSYKSNKVAKIQIKAQTSTFTGGTGLPVSALTYKLNGASGNPIALTASNVDLATDLAKGTHEIGIDYTITPGLTADPADYAIVVEYTITAP